MKPTQAIRKICTRCGCACVSLGNFILFTLATIQAMAIGFFLFQNNLPIPGFVNNLISAQLSDDVSIEYNNLQVDLFGGFFFENLTIRNSLNNEPMFSFEALRGQLSLSNLLLGNKPLINEFQVFNGNVFISAIHSPSGNNEPILNDVTIEIKGYGEYLMIDRLSAKYQDIHVSLQGEGYFPLPLKKQINTVADSHRVIVQSLLDLREHIPLSLTTPLNLHLNWSRKKNRNSRLDAIGWIESLSWKHHINADHVLFSAKDIQPEARSIGPAKLVARKISSPRSSLQSGPITLYFNGGNLPGKTSTSSSSIHASLRNLCFRNFKNAILQINWNPYDQLKHFEFLFGYGQGQVNGNLLFSEDVSGMTWPDMLAKAHVQGTANLPHDPQLINRLNEHLPLFENFPVSWDNLQIRFSGFGIHPSERSWKLNFISDGLRVSGINYDSVSSNFHLDEHQFSLDRIFIKRNRQEFVRGSFSQNLDTLDFHMALTGSVFPDILDSYLPFHWWQNLWKNMEVSEVPVDADVYVHGNWNTMSDIQNVTRAKTKHLTFNHATADFVDVRVRHKNSWTAIENLYAEKDDGHLEARFFWFRLPDHPHFVRRQWMQIESTLDWETVVDALPSNPSEALSFPSPPNAQIQGNSWIFHDKEREDLRDWDFTLLEAPYLNIHNLNFDNVLASGSISNDSIRVSQLHARLAEGSVEGSFYRKNLDDGSNAFSLKASIQNASYPKFVNGILPFFDPDKELYDEFVDPAVGGRISADFSLKGNSDAFQSFQGNGRFAVDNANLGTIHIFGGLSRLLSTIGLNFTSLSLQKAEASWVWNQDTLRFSQMVISGPTASIDAQGSLSVPDTNLDFQVNAFGLNSLIGVMMSPLSSNFGFQLSGTLADPQWSWRITPFRWLFQDSPDPSNPSDPSNPNPANSPKYNQ